jgi:RNA polymerase sigma-70 factor (ECF subfamily)
MKALGKENPSELDDSTDEVLLAAVRRGEVEAFGRLVRRYQDRVFTVALRLTRNRATAEDMAQQAFLQAWQGRLSYDPRWRVSTWLYRIVTNLCIDERRRRARAAAFDPGFTPNRTAAAHEALEERELRERLNGSLRQLPKAQRTVLVLRYMDGLSPAEIGRICGLPVNTVKSHLTRGKATLRKILMV